MLEADFGVYILEFVRQVSSSPFTSVIEVVFQTKQTVEQNQENGEAETGAPRLSKNLDSFNSTAHKVNGHLSTLQRLLGVAAAVIVFCSAATVAFRRGKTRIQSKPTNEVRVYDKHPVDS